MLELSHKKLIAWQRAIEILPLLYKLCKKLPKEETYNLISQIKRAGLSISNNLAEGASRKSKIEKNRFFEIARSSLVEIDNCMIACLVLQYIVQAELIEIEPRLEELFKIITGLMNSNLN
ncbi:MAG: four helix bundle protein [Bacteroidota bacterium]|nr:four helix bundle protein [Bacteroidota bacterium]